MSMRLIQAGQDRASASVANQSALDALMNSRFKSDGSDFIGFEQSDRFNQDVTTTTGLTYGYRGGRVAPNGVWQIIAPGTVLLADNATNFVERDSAGAVSANTTGFTPGRNPMAKVVTASGSITSVTDWRLSDLATDVVIGAGNPNGVVEGKYGTIHVDKTDTSGRGHWRKMTGSGKSDWYRVQDSVHAGAYSLAANGSNDDAPALANADAAAVAAGAELYIPPGTYAINTPLTFNATLVVPNGVTFKLNARLTVNKRPHVGFYPWILRVAGDVKVGPSVSTLIDYWWTETSLAVPAPAATPALTNPGPYYGEGGAFANTKYRITFSILGKDDGPNGVMSETNDSPYYEITMPAGCAGMIGVDVRAAIARGFTGKGLAFYWQRETSPGSGTYTVKKRATYAPQGKHQGINNGKPVVVCDTYQPSDCNETNDGYLVLSMDDDSNSFWVKQYVGRSGSGTAPVDEAGNAIADPTIAPVATALYANPPATLFYACHVNVDTLGRSSGGGPVSNSVTTHATSGDGTPGGGSLTYFFNEIAPSGTLWRDIYTGPTPSTLRFQKRVRVGTASADIHGYNASGALLAASGNPASTVCPAQQMIDCNDASGGGFELLARGETINHSCPIIFRMSPGSKGGTHFRGLGAVDLSGNCQTKFAYTGTATGVDLAAVSVSSWTFQHFALTDPNQRAKVGIQSFDPFGGNGFYNRWLGVVVFANGVRSVGYLVNHDSAGQNGHTTSEQYFLNCYFAGADRGVHLSCSQTTDHVFVGGRIGCNGGSGSGPSGGASACSTDTVTMGCIAEYKNTWFSGTGERTHNVTNYLGRGAGGSAYLIIDNNGAEFHDQGSHAGNGFLVNSQLDTSGSTIVMIGCGSANSQGYPSFTDALILTNSVLDLRGCSFLWHIVLDHFAATYAGDRKSIQAAMYRKTNRNEDTSSLTSVVTVGALMVNALTFLSDDGTLIAMKKLDGRGTIAIGTIAAGARYTTTITITGLEFGDVFLRPALFSGSTPWSGAGLSPLEITNWEVSAQNTLLLTLYNPSGAGVTPGTLNYRIRGERTRPAAA